MEWKFNATTTKIKKKILLYNNQSAKKRDQELNKH